MGGVDVYVIRGSRAFLFAALAGAALPAGGCPREPAIPSVTVEARDFAFSSPASIPGGLTRLELKNVGGDSHHAQLLRLNDGVSQEQFQGTLEAALQAVPTEGEAALFKIFEVATLAGGPAGVAPGGDVDAVVDLAQGQYALVCFIAGADGIPHLAKGMVQPLEVTVRPSR